MKIRLMLSFLAILVLSSFTKSKDVEIVEEIPVVQIEEIVVNKPPTTDVSELMDAIGEFESNNRYDVVNRFGFMGRYQFSPRTVKHLGYEVSSEEFLNSPELQDEVMMSYLYENYISLKDYIDRYHNTVHKGIKITTSSILAGAHFAGAGGVKRFLNNTRDSVGTVDSNGMTLIKYMEKFSDYEVNLGDY